MQLKIKVKKFAEKIFQSKWYPNKKILLESVPDMSCQTYPVFQKMLENHLNDEYKIIWFVSDKNDFKDICIKNVKFMNFYPKTRFEKIQRMYTLCTSRAMLYANRYIGKVFEKQFFMYLKHGTACIKSRLKHCREDDKNECDACISISDFNNDIDYKELHIPREKFVVTGCPRNDYLFENKNVLNLLFPNKKYKKIVLWMPTFRKVKNSDRIDSTFDFPLGIPCIYTKEQCQMIDSVLKNEEILLVLKPHPAQDLSVIKDLDLKNFVMLYDEDIKKAGIQLYQFIGCTDALITDYSSVYFDYLLTGNMIGITLDDMEQYRKDSGFAIENILDILVGDYIKNCDELINFIKRVSVNDDRMYEKRVEICEKVHKYKDNNSSERVYNYILKELSARYKQSV